MIGDSLPYLYPVSLALEYPNHQINLFSLTMIWDNNITQNNNWKVRNHAVIGQNHLFGPLRQPYALTPRQLLEEKSSRSLQILLLGV